MASSVAFAVSRASVIFRWIIIGLFLIPFSVESLKIANTGLHPVGECFLPSKMELFKKDGKVFVSYTRKIACDMIGEYRVKIYPATGDQFPVCDNSETIPYTAPKDGKKEEFRTTVVPVERFVGEECALPDGDYFIEAEWLMTRRWFISEAVRLKTGPWRIE